MPKFAANLSMLFTEYPLADRFAAAERAGFDMVEIQFPYELDTTTLKQQITDNQLQLVLINFPAGDWATGDRGIACDPSRITEFQHGVDIAIDYATALNVTNINCLAGKKPDGVSNFAAQETFINNLNYAAERLNSCGIQLLVEAINTEDVPGFYLKSSPQAFSVLDAVKYDNIAFQYDVYHMQIMEGNLIQTLSENIDRIGHIQIADVPGRHEPGTGEINFPNVFKALDAMGYSGIISCEYVPVGHTEDGLNWIDVLE